MQGDEISILAAAVEVERFGFDLYTAMNECVKDPNGSALLRGLARDEAEHRRILEREILRLSPQAELRSLKPAEEYLGIVPDQVFPGDLGERCSTLQGEIEAVEIGIKVEKRSIWMYTDATGKVKDEKLKDLLEYLARWEGTHKKALEENLHMLKTGGSWYGYSPILEG